MSRTKKSSPIIKPESVSNKVWQDFLYNCESASFGVWTGFFFSLYKVVLSMPRTYRFDGAFMRSLREFLVELETIQLSSCPECGGNMMKQPGYQECLEDGCDHSRSLDED